MPAVLTKAGQRRVGVFGKRLCEMPDTPNIHGINRDVGHIAGVHSRRQLLHMVFADRQSTGEQDQSLPSGEGTQVPRQNLQGQEGGSSEIGTGATRSEAIRTRAIRTGVVAWKTAATLAQSRYRSS